MTHRRSVPALLLVLGGAGLAAAEIHVSNRDGDDARDGATPQAAVATFARAVGLLRPGDTLVIAGTGIPYRETLAIGRPIGTAARPLVVDGGGAVISGLRRLDPAAWQAAEGIWRYPVKKMPANCHPWLVLDGARVPAGAPAGLRPGEHAWTAEWILYRPAEGAVPSGQALDATLGDSGVALTAGFVTIRDLVCQENANDGFNVHGIARGVVLERVVGRDNGDDGCSIHEDCEITVRDSRFHGNDYGIEDVNASTSGYLGVAVTGNRVGIHFAGGWHRLVSSLVAGNREVQVEVSSSQGSMHLGKDDKGFRYDGACAIADSAIEGGPRGLVVGRRSQVAVMQSWLSGSATAVVVAAGGSADVRLSAIAAGETAVRCEGAWSGDRNLIHPDRLRWQGADGDLAAFRAAAAAERESLVQAPVPAADGRHLAEQPFLALGSTQRVGPLLPLPVSAP